MSAEEVKRLLEEGRKEYAEDPNNFAAIYKLFTNEYAYSLNILGENTLVHAKKLGYLDARELYPDIPVQSFAEYAKEFYALKEPGEVYRF